MSRVIAGFLWKVVKMALNKEAIVQTCVAILNRDGADGLSMRTLAKELGVQAASLYWHFSGKNELYGAIAEHLCQQYVLPPASGDLKADIMAYFRTYRAMLLPVRDSVTVFEDSLPNTPQRATLIRAFSQKLTEFGVRPENLMTVSNMLNNYVLSFTADEIRFNNTSPELKESFYQLVRSDGQPAQPYERDFDEQFDLGLEIMLAGIKAVEERQK